MILRNVSTLSGLVKSRRCWARKARPRIVWVTLDNDQNVTLPRIPMQKVSNGIKFRRWQVPLRLIYAGTVHCSQGMTLNRVVIDLRAPFGNTGRFM
jgi:ATP-dependent exoDNAse (exonuclease V) alpha subunit